MTRAQRCSDSLLHWTAVAHAVLHEPSSPPGVGREDDEPGLRTESEMVYLATAVFVVWLIGLYVLAVRSRNHIRQALQNHVPESAACRFSALWLQKVGQQHRSCTPDRNRPRSPRTSGSDRRHSVRLDARRLPACLSASARSTSMDSTASLVVAHRS